MNTGFQLELNLHSVDHLQRFIKDRNNVRNPQRAAVTQIGDVTALMDETLDLGPEEIQGARSETMEDTDFVDGFSRA